MAGSFRSRLRPIWGDGYLCRGVCGTKQWLWHDPAEVNLRLLAVPSTGHALLESEPVFVRDGKPIEHPLEHLLKASGWAILTSIERQRMSVMNVKGQLAEYYLYRILADKLVKG